jgi:hypothetical protein
MSRDQLIQAALASALDPTEYHAGFEQVVAAGSTSGPDRSEALVAYTMLNLARARRWNTRMQVLPELQAGLPIRSPQTWLVLTEYWCGDVAQCCPAMVHLAERTPGLQVRFVFRDEHPELMDLYLTRGGRSIPKLVALDDATGAELFTWGPRPEPAQAVVDSFLAIPKEQRDSEAMKESLHAWYAKDGCAAVQRELLARCAEAAR